MFNLDLFLKQHNKTVLDLIEMIKSVLEFAKELKDEDNSKIKNAMYCYNWLLQELSPLTSYKIERPTNKKRKDAIEITEKICDKTEKNEQVKNNVKIVAEYLKAILS